MLRFFENSGFWVLVLGGFPLGSVVPPTSQDVPGNIINGYAKFFATSFA